MSAGVCVCVHVVILYINYIRISDYLGIRSRFRPMKFTSFNPCYWDPCVKSFNCVAFSSSRRISIYGLLGCVKYLGSRLAAYVCVFGQICCGLQSFGIALGESKSPRIIYNCINYQFRASHFSREYSGIRMALDLKQL